MDDDSLSGRAKFAIVMVSVVILISIGLRVYWYFHPIEIDSIFVEEVVDFDLIEEQLFGDEAVKVDTNDTSQDTLDTVQTITSVRDSAAVMERLGTHSLTAGKEVDAVRFQDYFLIGFTRDNVYYLQTYDQQWQLVTDAARPELVIDTEPALQRQLFATNEAVFLFSYRATTSGFALDMKEFDTKYQLVQTIVLFDETFFPNQELSADTDFITNVHDSTIETYVRFTDSAAIIEYTSNGLVQNERTLADFGTPVSLTVDDANNRILVTQQETQLRFNKFSSTWEELADYAIDLEADYSIHNFQRLGEYIIFVGTSDAADLIDSQLWVMSDNLQTIYPAIHFSATMLSPTILVNTTDIFLVYGLADTTTAGAADVTTYTIQVDNLAISP